MSMPRRKTSSLRNSLWSWSSTGVRFMGEKPRAGYPAWGWRSTVSPGRAAGPRLGWGSTHRPDVAAVGGSWEDLQLERQLPVGRAMASAWHRDSWGACHPDPAKGPKPCTLQDAKSYSF